MADHQQLAAAIRAQLGDTKPADDELVLALAETVRGRREHQHPRWEDIFCENLSSWAADRVGPLLQRLADALDPAQDAEDPRVSAARTIASSLAALAGELAVSCEPAIADIGASVSALLAPWQDTDGAALPDVATYRAQRGAADDPDPVHLGPYRRLEDAKLHAEDDYRDHHDPRRSHELWWMPVDGWGEDRIWLHASTHGGPPEPTDWHVQTITVAGTYDPDAEG